MAVELCVTPNDSCPRITADRPFGFQDAWYEALSPSTVFPDWRGMGNTLVINERGCSIGVGQHNCTQACLDPRMVWQDQSAMYTMQNCMLYPVISSMLSKDSLSDKATTQAEQYGFLNSTAVDLSTIIHVISSCVDDYCSGNDCLPWNPATAGYSGDIPPKSKPDAIQKQISADISLQNLPTFRSNWCDNVTDIMKASPDLGGPGVFASYLIQIFLAFILYVTLRFFSTWIRNTIFWLIPLPFLGPLIWHFRKGGMQARWDYANRVQAKWTHSEQGEIFDDFLDKFQKAQCFFMLPVQIAAMLAIFDPERNLLDASTLQQLVDNRDLLQSVAWNGIIPIVFVQFLLHTIRKGTWLTFVLSLTTLTLSAVNYYEIDNRAPSRATVADGQGAAIASCGGISPVQYCYTTKSSIMLNDEWLSLPFDGTPKHIIEACFAMLVLLLLDLCALFPARKKDQVSGEHKSRRTIYVALRDWIKTWKIWSKYEQRGGKLKFLRLFGLETRDGVIHATFQLIILVIDIFFVAGLALVAEILGQYLTPSSDSVSIDTSKDAWTFGQFIAIAVWVPVVMDWISASIGK